MFYVGLTTDSSKLDKNRCDRCDLLLKYSIWNGVMMCYSATKSSTTGFLCIQCAVGCNKRIKPKISQDQADNFVMNLQEKPLVT